MGHEIHEDRETLVEIGQEALRICASLYHCARTNCRCGFGKDALKDSAEQLKGVVTDEATGRAYAEAIVFTSHLLANPAKTDSDAGILINIVLCESLRIAGLITEEEIEATVKKVADAKRRQRQNSRQRKLVTLAVVSQKNNRSH